jgi:hypothetical protein
VRPSRSACCPSPAILAENLLLEYTEGMDKAQVGWGCVGHTELQSLMNLHTASTDFAQRTPEGVRSNLVQHRPLSTGRGRTMACLLKEANHGSDAAGDVEISKTEEPCIAFTMEVFSQPDRGAR